MTKFSKAEVEETIDALIAHQGQASESGDWSSWAERFYTPDAVYICEYGPLDTVEARGLEAIKATHLGRDMEGWENWTFPYIFRMVDGERVMTQWMNRGPGRRPDGSYYETPGVSWFSYAGKGKFCYQFDLFDIAHQMQLCDELDEQGLLKPVLREKVAAIKRRLVETLSRRL